MNKYKYPIVTRIIGDFLSIPIICLSLLFIGLMGWIFITDKKVDLVGMSLGLALCVFCFSFSYWHITAYPNIKLSEEGIYYRRLFRWHIIQWNKIQTITHYDTKGWRTTIPNKGTITSITTGYFKRNLFITDSMIDYNDAMNYVLEHAKEARVMEFNWYLGKLW